MRRSLLAALTVPVLAASVLAGGDAAGAAPSTHGTAGSGDPYFPRQGNGGYNVQHYYLQLKYSPGSDEHLAGTAHISATTAQRLSTFHLDLRRTMVVYSVTVNGKRAKFAQPKSQKQELVITAPRTLASHQKFTVVVRYHGLGRTITDPDGSPDGWIKTADGAFVASEPQGSPSWFPVNDTPRDKATYTLALNVPRGLAAISNGALLSHTAAGRRAFWTWKLTKPVSSYLVTATIGRFSISRGTTSGGVPYLIAVDPTQKSQAGDVYRNLPKIVDFFSSRYGAYPFPWTGAIVDNAPNVGYALETASRPLFPKAPSDQTLAHELAHQWYGDTVTLDRWRDIWINEGFAEFSSWLWDQHVGRTSMAQHLKNLLATPADNYIWNPPPADPGSNVDMFADSVYERGAGALEALRELIGGDTFFKIMRGWVAAHRYGNATVGQFTAYAAKVSHRNLTHFFDVWLYRKGKPSNWK